MAYSYTVSGAQLFRMEMQSPLLLAVMAAVLIPSAALLAAVVKGWRLPGTVGSRRAMVYVIAAAMVIGVAAIPTATYIGVRPELEYGLQVSDLKATVRFYGDNVVEFNVCEATYSLTSVDEAVSMLKVRTNGLSDPATGIHMGYYKARDGSKAYVIVASKLSDKALVARLSDGSYVIVALPGIENAYKTLTSLKQTHCVH